MSRFAMPFAAFAVVLVPACFNPVSGTYEFMEGDTTTDCPETDDTGTDDTGTEDMTEEVVVNDDKTEMTIGEGEFAYDCTLDGRDFSCPMDPFVYDMSAYGYDAVATTSFDFTGAWTSNTSFDMTAAADITCVGADCETIGFPNCSATSTASAELVEAAE